MVHKYPISCISSLFCHEKSQIIPSVAYQTCTISIITYFYYFPLEIVQYLESKFHLIVQGHENFEKLLWTPLLESQNSEKTKLSNKGFIFQPNVSLF